MNKFCNKKEFFVKIHKKMLKIVENYWKCWKLLVMTNYLKFTCLYFSKGAFSLRSSTISPIQMQSSTYFNKFHIKIFENIQKNARLHRNLKKTARLYRNLKRKKPIVLNYPSKAMRVCSSNWLSIGWFGRFSQFSHSSIHAYT